ncbi:hypothetical protein M430DRAFT_239756 [Amorphotheca resinae ATCC 22711]|uniref:Uncharacterized protein n=1 Tax=Amorphotheca resinae ATCC 22711 TaxID=857342 RepID=A0A2T3B1L6_AMORE|nr:hypothetical protein M430DRAFT_239756 [Amorphotheca resinae ATCC 22711]PSS18464.1 hypothetical protein M430DRAFT_239756 [Amorphotheca resinae ATCC 22711]
MLPRGHYSLAHFSLMQVLFLSSRTCRHLFTHSRARGWLDDAWLNGIVRRAEPHRSCSAHTSYILCHHTYIHTVYINHRSPEGSHKRIR